MLNDRDEDGGQSPGMARSQRVATGGPHSAQAGDDDDEKDTPF